jgi:hypothetical protein
MQAYEFSSFVASAADFLVLVHGDTAAHEAASALGLLAAATGQDNLKDSVAILLAVIAIQAAGQRELLN